MTRVPAVHQPGGRAVDADLAGAAPAGDRVGLEAGAVVDVDDVDLLVLEDVGGLEQVGVDRDRADVVQVAVGDRGTVDLGLEHHALHVWIAFPRGVRPARGCRIVLSIRRISPTRRRHGQQGRTVELVERLEGLRVDQCEVLERHAAAGQDFAAGRRAAPRPSALRPRCSRAAASSAPDSASACSRSAGESSALRLDIARPSGSRTVGSDLDRDGKVEVGDQPADHDDLLGVLLAEVGDVGKSHAE